MILRIVGIYLLVGAVMLGGVILFYKKCIPEFYESMTEDVRTSSTIKAVLLILCVAALWPLWILEDIRNVKEEIIKRTEKKDKEP